MIVPHCIPIYAANPSALPEVTLMHCLPMLFLCNSQMYLLMWMQLFTLWMIGRMKLFISGSTSGFHYMLDTVENEGAQRQIALLSQPRFLPLITYTLRNTHMHAHIHTHTYFYLSAVITCTVFCDAFFFFVTTSWSSFHVRIFDHFSSFFMRILENRFFHNLCNHSYVHKRLSCLQFFQLQRKSLKLLSFCIYVCAHMQAFLKTDFKKRHPKVMHVFVFDRHHQITTRRS